MGPLQNASTFLIQSVIDLYLLILILRLVLQYLRVDYYNPLTQFIVKATSPVVVPLRRIVPGYWGVDFATIIVILGVTLLKITLISAIALHKLPAPTGLILWAFGDVCTLTIKLFFYAVLMTVILSWVAPLSHSPMATILCRLTEPFMRPARRIMPPIGGFDLSPVLVMIVLELLTILFANPLTQMGINLANH